MVAKAHIALSDEVKDVLNQSEITATTLRLPGTLERKMYEAVNKIIVAAGGKWDRKAQCHIFKADPREVLGLAIDKGAIVDKKQLLQQFYTPPDVVKLVLRAAQLKPGMTVLEPSAGQGAIALAARSQGANVTCVEIDPANVGVLEGKQLATVCADFMDPATLQGQTFDRVLMNPPFTSKAGMGAQDIAHVTRAFQFLKPGGRLVAIMSPSWQTASTKQAKTFREVFEDEIVMEELPDASFATSGTRVNTVLIVINHIKLK